MLAQQLFHSILHQVIVAMQFQENVLSNPGIIINESAIQ